MTKQTAVVEASASLQGLETARVHIRHHIREAECHNAQPSAPLAETPLPETPFAAISQC
jgi:hypothetical protein